MASITLKGNPIHTIGKLPAVGSTPADFKLLTTDLKEVTMASYTGTTKVLNIFPSVDTSVCATSVRKFNEQVTALKDTVVLNISADLPFALKRFCGAEGIERAESLSSFRSTFGKDWQVEMTDGPFAGLLSRAVVVLDADNKVIYSEQVPEIVQEPNYEHALAAAGEKTAG